MVFLDGCGLGQLQHRHAGDTPQDVVGLAFVRRRKMKDNHERHAWGLRHVFKKPHQGLNTAGRCTDPDNRKVEGRRFAKRCWLVARSMIWFLHPTRQP